MSELTRVINPSSSSTFARALACRLRPLAGVVLASPALLFAAPPVLTVSSPDLHYYYVPEDRATLQWGYAITASNSPTSYDAVGLPANAFINKSTGLLSGATDVPGVFPLTLSATNADGTGTAQVRVSIHPGILGVTTSRGNFSIGQSFTITLACNRPMTVTGQPKITFSSGTSERAAVYASGSGTASIVFRYTVVAGDSSEGEILIRTLDFSSGSLRDANNLEPSPRLPLRYFTSGITYSAPAAALTVTSGSASGVIGQSFTFTVATTASPTAFSATGLPPGLAISNAGVIAGVPTSAGTFQANVTAANISGATATGTIGISITAPAATPPSPQSAPPAASVPPTTSTLSIPVASRLINVSSRVHLRAGDPSRSFLAGFVVSGPAPKRVLVRAVGPALASLGVPAALANPRLRVLTPGGAVVAENDDWNGADVAAAFSRLGAFALPAGSRDAALLVTLPPGAYSLEIVAEGDGVVLAEIYDAGEATADSQPLINISTRAYVDSGDAVLAAGFVVTGSGPKRVLIRGIGPTLATFGVAGALADPALRVYAGETLMAQNDNWQTAEPSSASRGITPTELAAAAGTSGAFPLADGSKDAALILTLPPGAYSAVVSGGGTSGTALVEVYELPFAATR